MRTVSLAGALLLATGCGEEIPAPGDIPDWGTGEQDSGTSPSTDASSPSETPPPWVWPDASSPTQPDPGPGTDPDVGPAPVSDAGTEQPIPLDDASVPPPTDGGKWTLKAGSAPECPEEPPPIPLLGGLCLGVYWSCGWENEAGEQYSCVCDWVHYLCLPL